MKNIYKLIRSILIILIGFILFSCGVNGQKQDKPIVNSTTVKRIPIGKLSKFEKNGRFGYKDEKGNIIVNPVYNQLPEYPWEIMNVEVGEECGLINYLGDTLIEFGKYQLLKIEHSLPFNTSPDANGVQFFSDSADWNWVCQQNNLFGMIDKSEKALIPIEFEKYEYIFANRYAFYKNGRWTVYSSKGQKLTPLEFDDVSMIFKGKYFIYKKDDLQGVFNIQKNQDALGRHDMIIGMEANVIGTKDNNKYTLYNLDGDRLSDLNFDTLYINLEVNSPVDESTLLKYTDQKIIGWARSNENTFLINKEGEVIEVR